MTSLTSLCICCRRSFHRKYPHELLCPACASVVLKPIKFKAVVTLDAGGFIWIEPDGSDKRLLNYMRFKLENAGVQTKRWSNGSRAILAKAERLFLPEVPPGAIE